MLRKLNNKSIWKVFIFYNYILFDELKNNKQFGSSKDNTFIGLFLQRGERLYTSKSDVYRRQILTYKDGSRARRVKVG